MLARGDKAASKTSRQRKKSTGNSKSPVETTRAATAVDTENDAETANFVAALLRAGRVAERSNAGTAVSDPGRIPSHEPQSNLDTMASTNFLICLP